MEAWVSRNSSSRPIHLILHIFNFFCLCCVARRCDNELGRIDVVVIVDEWSLSHSVFGVKEEIGPMILCTFVVATTDYTVKRYGKKSSQQEEGVEEKRLRTDLFFFCFSRTVVEHEELLLRKKREKNVKLICIRLCVLWWWAISVLHFQWWNKLSHIWSLSRISLCVIFIQPSAAWQTIVQRPKWILMSL